MIMKATPKNIKELEEALEEVDKEISKSQQEQYYYEVLKAYKGEDEVISFKQYLDYQKTNKTRTVPSGFKGLDDYVEGFRGGELVVITAPTGEGKTTFCQNITLNLLNQDVRSLWFSYEVSIQDFIQKFGEEIPEGYLPKILTERNLVWIERKIVEAIAKYEVRAVFIDHLHYLFDLKNSRNTSLEIGEIVRTLKIIAKKYGITIFLVAHIGKVDYEGRVGLENIRDSSFVAQEADTVIALWRVKERLSKLELREKGTVYKNETMVSIVKNRFNGRLGTSKLIFHKNKFYENDEDIPTPEPETDSSIG